MRYENLYFNPQGLLTHIGDREDVSDSKYISAREFSALPTHALRTLQGVCMTVKHRFPDALLSCPSLMWIDLKIGIKNRTDLETTTRDIRWDNLETLQHLTLRGWPLLDYAPLSSLPALRTLCVETRRDVSQAVARWANFEALQGLGQLTSLDTLTLQGLPDGHIPESLEGLKRLKHLDLYDHRLILDEVGLINVQFHLAVRIEQFGFETVVQFRSDSLKSDALVRADQTEHQGVLPLIGNALQFFAGGCLSEELFEPSGSAVASNQPKHNPNEQRNPTKHAD